MTAGKKCLADCVIQFHDLITRKLWLLENDMFENSSLSAQTHLINKCTVLLHLTYSQGLLGLKIMYLISGNHKKSLLHRTVLVCHNLYCSFAIYAVLMHSMLLDCNMCCFIAVHATLIPFCCNLRCFVAAI